MSPERRALAGYSTRLRAQDPVGSVVLVSVLRDVERSDVDVFFEHQSDPEAAAMAVFPARDREAFDAHWRRLLADDSLVTRTIVADGTVAGNIGCWTQDGLRLVGYWVGRDFWGRGLATTALAELAAEIPERPLHAWVAATNVGSIRVLEKCGFVEVERRAEHDEHAGRVTEEILYRLD
jgi:RimJ/RimL family protein N-acetyltransferase